MKLWNWLSVESYSAIARSVLCEWCCLSVDHLVLFSHSSPAYAEEREDSDGHGLCIHHITCEWQRQNWKWYFLAHSFLSSQHFAFLRDISKRLDSKHYHFLLLFTEWVNKNYLLPQYSCLENPWAEGLAGHSPECPSKLGLENPWAGGLAGHSPESPGKLGATGATEHSTRARWLYTALNSGDQVTGQKSSWQSFSLQHGGDESQ